METDVKIQKVLRHRSLCKKMKKEILTEAQQKAEING